MKFNIGDTVAVIDDMVKGEVTAIEKNAITIMTEDGFSFNYLPKELVVIKENQSDLSKFRDIANEKLLKESIAQDQKRKKIQFKSDLKPNNMPAMEVDLHAHQLVSSTRGLDNYDILNLQIEHAKHKLEFAIQKKIPKIVFIHGVGEGVLKSELEFLFKKYQVAFYAASYKKYGLGATEVRIFQNPKN